MGTSPSASGVDQRPSAPVSQRILAARTGVAFVFGLNGLALGSWFARVPAARDAFDLSAGRMGLLLLALSAGSLLALPLAGAVVHRLGSARSVRVAAGMVAVGLTVIGLTVGGWTWIPAVALGLFGLGFSSGICEVAMNVEGAAVERLLGRNVMPRFHAAWSLGTVGGALIGAGSVRIGLPIAVHLAIVAVVVAAGAAGAVRSFLPTASASPTDAERADHPDGAGDPHGTDRVEGPDGVTRRRGSGALAAWREPRTVLIGLLVLVMAFTEGTANDWVALAFVDGHAVTETVGAVAYGVFVAAMTLGRTTGTVALDRWGRIPVLLATIVLAAAGVVIAVLASPWPVALVGVVLWGLGASLGFPVGMSAAADQQERAAARVSVVSAIGYTAFLAGPPLVGLLGDWLDSVLRALLVVPLLLIPALFLVPTARPPADDRAAD